MPKIADTGALSVSGPLSPRIANYIIDADYVPTEAKLRGRVRIEWKNTGLSPVTRIPLHLYLNAFKNSETIFMRETEGQFREDKMRKDGWGYIEITSLSINEGPKSDASALSYEDGDETLAWVAMGEPVSAFESVMLDIEFKAKLPKVYARTGVAKDFAMVAQWFPKVGVRLGPLLMEAWKAEHFHGFSEFFADFGVYDVTLRAPSTHVVAATGVLVAVDDLQHGIRQWRFRAEDVHDFAWVVDPHLRSLSGVAHVGKSKVDVRVLHYPAQLKFAKRHLDSAIRAVEVMSRMYRAYPWTTLTIIDPPPHASGASGMEYPTLITTAGDSLISAASGVRMPEQVTLHEVGHQWFQGMLAFNEVEDAWLDEGLNTYSNHVVAQEIYGPADYFNAAGFRASGAELDGFAKAMPYIDPIDQPSYRFADFSQYGGASYARLGAAFTTLERVIGPKSFRSAMSTFTRRYAFTHPTRSDLLETLESELNQDLSWFLEPVLDRRGSAELVVHDVTCRRKASPAGFFGRDLETKVAPEPLDGNASPESDSENERGNKTKRGYDCNVVVANLGLVPVPVRVDITLSNGHRTQRRWEDRGQGPRWIRFVLEASSPIAEVVIDPDRKILIDKGGTRRSWRRVPDTRAAKSLSSSAQFWVQTLMQGMGI